ncbi:MAG: HAMP domain-containing histidine kinase [Bacteroidetes bacterium]|nr:HAMP domain-containing histidine kinase [Bacteroidota bacterium]
MNIKKSNNVADKEALIERIKELECLYDLSALTAKHHDSEKLFPLICDRVSAAWKFSKEAITVIKLGHVQYASHLLDQPSVYVAENIHLEEEIVGRIEVHYPTTLFDKNAFLPEEKKLLKKLASEISIWLERKKRMQNEESLKRIVEQQDRLSILGEMTAGIAHELNTPLGNILGFSEFIIKGSDTTANLEDAKKIYQSALHARTIVKKLMFFSCEIPQNITSVCINDLIKEALELLNPTITKSRVTVQFHADNDNCKAYLDKTQFIQVVFNLVNNAIHASNRDETVTLRLTIENGYLHFLVQDTGKGIKEDEQDKIFEPFYTTKSKKNGTGLGLSVVHGIVKSHKGRIQLSSELNKGTTFVISIPLKQ